MIHVTERTGSRWLHDDATWTVYERSLYIVDLKTIWGADPDDIWFGGEDGYLLHY